MKRPNVDYTYIIRSNSVFDEIQNKRDKITVNFLLHNIYSLI